MKTIVMTAIGGTEVLEMIDLPNPVPGPGEVLVEVAASGVNFMDVVCAKVWRGKRCRCRAHWALRARGA